MAKLYVIRTFGTADGKGVYYNHPEYGIFGTEQQGYRWLAGLRRELDEEELRTARLVEISPDDFDDVLDDVEAHPRRFNSEYYGGLSLKAIQRRIAA